MTRIITDDSGSRRSVRPTEKSPEVIQVNTRCAMSRFSGSRLTRRATAAAEIANDSSIAPHAIAPAAVFVETAAEAGVQQEAGEREERDQQQHVNDRQTTLNAEIAEIAEHNSSPRSLRSLRCNVVVICLPFQARERVRVERLAVAEQPDHDRAGRRRLRRRRRSSRRTR